MADRGLTVDEIMAILPETPRRIAALTDGLTPTQSRASPHPDSWSVNDVLAHLRACHDVLGGNILRILAEDMPTWKGMNPRAWIKQTDYPEWEFAPAFEAFKQQRAELLAVVEPLPPEAWARTAMVTGMLGEIYERSARYYGDWLAGHERAHWKHLERIVGVVEASTPGSGGRGHS
jgi:DinB superfamily